MKQSKNRMFTKESGTKHFIMLAIAFFVLAWTYVAFALIKSDWIWFLPALINHDLPQKVAASWCLIAGLLVACGLSGMLTYWNARSWMLPCLRKTVFYIIGMIPFVKRWIPEHFRQNWRSEYADLTASDEKPKKEADTAGEEETQTEGGLPWIIAFPVSIIKVIFQGTVLAAVYLIAAIGLPVCSPGIAWLSLFGARELLKWNATAATIGYTVTFLLAAAILIVYPILCVRKKKEKAPAEPEKVSEE